MNLSFVRRPRFLIILPAWFGLSLFMLIGLLFQLSNSPTQYAFTPDREKVLGAYNLYAALPKESVKLSQEYSFTDVRAKRLATFFNYYRAPEEMIAASEEFVKAADQYQLPWTLLPAIACKESGCGRVIPFGSYNPFGWGVYTGQKTGVNFSSFSDAAWKVATGLRKDYFDKGLDTAIEIEARYTPSSAAGEHHWQQDVEYFMQVLNNWQIN